MSGTIPTTQLFNNFKQLPDSQLLTMSLTDLQKYATTVSTTIALEQSSIAGNQANYLTYSELVNVSQSTVDGIGYEIAANDLIVNTTDMQIADLSGQSAALLSTITNYQSSIDVQNGIVENASSIISSLTAESGMIDSTLNISQLGFVSTAKYYSTLYMTFMAKDLIYQNRLNAISTTSSILSAAIEYEKITYDNWQASTVTRQAIDSQLANLYTDSNAIQSTLTRYKIEETLAIGYYDSTNQAVNSISSLYAGSLLNQQYYESLSTQTGYTNALTTATTAATTAKNLSVASPNDTTLSAAATLAANLVTSLAAQKSAATTETAKLQALVANITADTYAATVAQYQNQIQIEINNISTFESYKTQSLGTLAFYSTLYDQSEFDVASSILQINTFSTLYDSSIVGSNTLMRIAAEDTSTIAGKQDEITAISMMISSMNIEYTNYDSSYKGYVSISTLMKKDVDIAVADLAIYSTFYESTTSALTDYTIQLQAVQGPLTSNTALLLSQSSILAYETINLKAYTTQLRNSINTQERASFAYRETYVRQKRISAQIYYDSIIADAIKTTAKTNEDAQKVAGPGAAIKPIEVDLTTPDITLAFTNLTTITAFLNTFMNIYGNYDVQTKNLQAVSTAVGGERESLNALTKYQTAYMVSPTPTNAMILNSAQNDYNEAMKTYASIVKNIDLTQSQIDVAKPKFQQGYVGVFKSDEIFNNESTISSFLV
jgi:hypothetical protein